MKKSLCILILCTTITSLHPMLSRWLQRGRNTSSMQRSKPALNKVTPVRTYGTGGQWSWWNEIKYKVNRAWSNFMTPAVKEKIKEKSVQIITPVAEPIARRVYEYQDRKNEATALQMFPKLYDNYQTIGITTFNQNGLESGITKGLDTLLDMVKILRNTATSFLPWDYLAPDSIKQAMNKVLPDGHTLFYHYLINKFKSIEEGVNTLFKEYEKNPQDIERESALETIMRRHVSEGRFSLEYFTQLGAELNAEDIAGLKKFIIDDFKVFRSNIKEVSVKDAKILAQRIWVLKEVKDIFDQSAASPETNDYSLILKIASPDGIIYEIHQKDLGQLAGNFAVDTLVKKIKDLEYRPPFEEGKVRHITREEDEARSFASSIRNLIKTQEEINKKKEDQRKSRYLRINRQKEDIVIDQSKE